MKATAIRLTFTFPPDLAKEFQKKIVAGERSEIMQQAAREAILQKKRMKAFRQIIAMGKKLPKNLPDSVEFLRRDRQSH